MHFLLIFPLIVGLHSAAGRAVRVWRVFCFHNTTLNWGTMLFLVSFLKLIQNRIFYSLASIYLLFHAEWGKYHGWGGGWSLWFLYSWKGRKVFFFLINVNTFLFYFVVSILASLSSLASHGAESAQVKFVSSGPVWPALLSPGLWGYLGTR